MGCDIHLVVQKRIDSNAPWTCVQKVITDEYEDSKTTLESWYDTRNYTVFAILANVRNGGRFKFISDPRGIPEDMKGQVDDRDSYLGFWLGEHSHSFVSLRELMNVDWSEEVGNRALGPKIGDAAGDFYSEFLPKLAALGREVGEDNVRIVFGFDN